MSILSGLKKDIRAKEEMNFVTEAASEAVADDAIKSAFLDDPEAALVGAESDPEVAELVEELPEYDDHDPDVISEIETAAESWVPETDL